MVGRGGRVLLIGAGRRIHECAGHLFEAGGHGFVHGGGTRQLLPERVDLRCQFRNDRVVPFVAGFGGVQLLLADLDLRVQRGDDLVMSLVVPVRLGKLLVRVTELALGSLERLVQLVDLCAEASGARGDL